MQVLVDPRALQYLVLIAKVHYNVAVCVNTSSFSGTDMADIIVHPSLMAECSDLALPPGT